MITPFQPQRDIQTRLLPSSSARLPPLDVAFRLSRYPMPVLHERLSIADACFFTVLSKLLYPADSEHQFLTVPAAHSPAHR